MNSFQANHGVPPLGVSSEYFEGLIEQAWSTLRGEGIATPWRFRVALQTLPTFVIGFQNE